MSTSIRRASILLLGLATVAVGWHAALAGLGGPVAPIARGLRAPLPPVPVPTAPDEEIARPMAFPDGTPPRVTCDGARRVVRQATRQLAMPAARVDPARFATGVSDWLDPHGLWSVSPDSPVGGRISELSQALLRELEADVGSGPCGAARAVGVSLDAWTDELRGELASARQAARTIPVDLRRGFELSSQTPFEDGTVTRPARELSRLIGQRLGSGESAYGAAMGDVADTAVSRLLPDLAPESWEGIVLAAAVRAYVPQIDPHGAWAPFEEESSIYDVGLEAAPPARLWEEMTRTPLGVRIDGGAHPPLESGDVVLAVGERVLGGMSVEQANQLSFVPAGAARRVSVLRPGGSLPINVDVEAELVFLAPPPGDSQHTGLVSSRIPYGAGDVLVVGIPDVPDDLGDRLIVTLREARRTREPLGIVLDLRKNGGGSTDGAMGALGVFMPGVPLFPMRRRDGEIEVDRAARVAPEDEWQGPVAALVDGDSASAAEMIAGALSAYQRGPVLGTRTYGKGCAQEYLEDEAGVGVLRLTTLVFCLPGGSPLQRVGIAPDIALGLPASPESESTLTGAAEPWRGPDVRHGARFEGLSWPSSGGRVGSTHDLTLTRALRSLGTTRAAAR